MLKELRELQKQSGAILRDNDNIVDSFGNDSQGLNCAYNNAVLCDRSHWGLLTLTGEDRLRFLHNQTTNNINALKPGQLSDTVFVNSTGRTLDLATAYVTEDSIVLLVAPNRRQFLLEWMDRYIFPMDKVAIADISQQNAILTIIGKEGSNKLQKWDLTSNIIPQLSPGNHDKITLEEETIIIAYGSGTTLPGYTLIVPETQAKTIWETLTNLGIIPMGDRLWEQLRIKQGRPYPEQELTEDYNPLEAGLWSTISFDKGCYIGQETIARLNTYQGVKQRLWGVKLDQLVPLKTPITVEDNKVGILTSCTQIDNEVIGLGYVKTKAGGEGLKVNIGEARGELMAVPFLTHEYYRAG